MITHTISFQVWPPRANVFFLFLFFFFLTFWGYTWTSRFHCRPSPVSRLVSHGCPEMVPRCRAPSGSFSLLRGRPTKRAALQHQTDHKQLVQWFKLVFDKQRWHIKNHCAEGWRLWTSAQGGVELGKIWREAVPIQLCCCSNISVFELQHIVNIHIRLLIFKRFWLQFPYGFHSWVLEGSWSDWEHWSVGGRYFLQGDWHLVRAQHKSKTRP